MSMIYLVLVKKGMLHYEQDVKVLSGMGQNLFDHDDIFSKVKLEGVWIKRREVGNGARRIRS